MHDWIPGVPEEAGIYWFTPHTNRIMKDLGPLVLQIREGSKEVFGNWGSGPLSFVHDKKLPMKAFYSKIESHGDWIPLEKEPVCNNTRYWIKTPKDYIGFGLLKRSWFSLYGTVLWLNHPTDSGICGIDIKYNSGYHFYPVEEPKRYIESDYNE